MPTDLQSPTAQDQADLEEVCRLISEGRKVTDPELLRRIEQRADEAREETLRACGVQEIAVDVVRELRDPTL